MAELDKQTIQHLSKLCRIKCSEAEQENLLESLKKILNYVEQLNEVDTENVKPCCHVLPDMQNVMRPDVVEKPLSREVFLANAPSQIGGMIKVPTILKSNS